MIIWPPYISCPSVCLSVCHTSQGSSSHSFSAATGISPCVTCGSGPAVHMGGARTVSSLFVEAPLLVCHVTSRWRHCCNYDHCKVLFVLLGLKTEAAAQLRGVVVKPFIWRTANRTISNSSTLIAIHILAYAKLIVGPTPVPRYKRRPRCVTPSALQKSKIKNSYDRSQSMFESWENWNAFRRPKKTFSESTIAVTCHQDHDGGLAFWRT